MPIVDPFEEQASDAPAQSAGGKAIVDPFDESAGVSSMRESKILRKVLPKPAEGELLPARGESGLTKDLIREKAKVRGPAAGTAMAVDIIDMALGGFGMIANTLEAGVLDVIGLAKGDMDAAETTNKIQAEYMAQPENAATVAPIRTALDQAGTQLPPSLISRKMEQMVVGAQKNVKAAGGSTAAEAATPQLIGAAMSMLYAHSLTKGRAEKIQEAVKRGATTDQMAVEILETAAKKKIDTSAVTKAQVVSVLDDILKSKGATAEDLAKAYGSGIDHRAGARATASQLQSLSKEAPKTMPVDRLWEAKFADRTADPVPGKDLTELRQSINQNGIKEPITILVSTKGNLAFVSDGNTRLTIAREAGITDMPVRIERTSRPFTEEVKGKAKPAESLGLTKAQIDAAPETATFEKRGPVNTKELEFGEFQKEYRQEKAKAPLGGAKVMGAVAPLEFNKVGLVPQKTGVHFSQAQRETLSGKFFGTGLAAEEAYRLKLAEDPRIKTRISFYIDEGAGIRPEVGVGAYEHQVPLNNLYDAAKNPLKLSTESYATGNLAGPDFNRFESAVLDAGFDGYYIKAAHGKQGGAVLLGQAAEAVRVMPKNSDTLINVGLNTNGGVGITRTQVEAALRDMDVLVVKGEVHASNTEPTFAAKITRQLTPEEATKLSMVLKQEAIAQTHNGKGELYGPAKDKWGPFNPEYFLTPDGKKLNEGFLGSAFKQRGAIGNLYTRTLPEAMELATKMEGEVGKRTEKGWQVSAPMGDEAVMRLPAEDRINLAKAAGDVYKSNYFKSQRGAVGDLTYRDVEMIPTKVGQDVKVYINPSKEKIHALFERAAELRTIKDQYGNKMVWDAYQLSHTDVMQHYGMPEKQYQTRGEFKAEEHYLRTETMLERNTKPTQQATPILGKKQLGVVDKQLIANAGLVLGGAALGAALNPNETTQGLLLGAAIGFGLANLPRAASAIRGNWKSGIKQVATGTAYATVGAFVDDENPVEGILVGSVLFGTRFMPKTKIHPEDQLINARNGNIAAEKRLTSMVAAAMERAIPDKIKREELAVLAEKPEFVGRTPEERAVVGAWRNLAQSYRDIAVNEGVKVGFIEGYVSHIIERDGLPQSEVQKVLTELFGTSEGAVGGKAKFTKERMYPTFESLEKALEGTSLKLKTKDIAEITRIYSETMNRTIENQKLINTLKDATLGDIEGQNAKLLLTEPQPSYMRINNPQLRPYYVHPDVAPALKFIFEARNHSELTNGLIALNRATKRINVVGSFFHAKSLLEAYALAGGDLFKTKSAVDAALKQFHEGGLGDEIDLGMRAGLRVELPTEVSPQALSQVGKLVDFYASKLIDKKIGVGEKIGGKIEAIQQATFDKFTWDYLHTGLKTATYLRLMEDYKLGSKGKGIAEDVYRQGVASHINDTFGGLDWYRVVSEAKTEAGRKLAMTTLSPSARDLLGVAIFAPDWTMSTVRAMSKALPGGVKNPANALLARQYALRTAILYATVLTGLNYALSGHFPWDNKDPTRLDLGDGTNLQVVKHSMEFAEWVREPWKTFGNKMGFLPRSFNAALYGKQYPHGPDIEGSRTGYVAAQIAPFTARAFQGDTEPQSSAARALLGMFGLSVYGQTEEARQFAKEARQARKEEKELNDPFKEEQ